MGKGKGIRVRIQKKKENTMARGQRTRQEEGKVTKVRKLMTMGNVKKTKGQDKRQPYKGHMEKEKWTIDKDKDKGAWKTGR